MTFPQDHTNFKKKSQLTRLMRQSPVFLNTQFIQTLETIGREEKKRGKGRGRVLRLWEGGGDKQGTKEGDREEGIRNTSQIAK